MGRRYAELAFTPLVKAQQQKHGSRHAYERVEQSFIPGSHLGADEQTMVCTRDSFYMATVSETGWPYIQHRGGPKGFLHVLDDQTLGFVDLRGNMQYVSAGNLEHNDRIALFLMDYPSQSRLKILGHAEVHEDDDQARQLIEMLRMPGEKSPTERAILIHVEAFDWNCTQHITPRYTQEELNSAIEPVQRRIEELERENARLRGCISA
ncbi:pyridoxamine 5'-phosphate oxidase family protein [Alloacidobacterium sp.]|uniref:pyridoxamine 5'-phosphate oxidase family protein n=1 Tax=Alloacidobacterium sp. TaxID=2951999 RepID=UPI002D246C9F|nr:pyridoxamine 5'-phosphate oxidase family protein [Alloacidobacterium sp.]HYK35676.1 pyridoxamine 5'-phosphate oxidase family protein [Alloacidobacterium sp.]